MKEDKNIQIHSSIVQKAYDTIPPAELEATLLSDRIAGRIEAIMKEQGITKQELAQKTNRKISDVTKWLGGGYNFTCKTIALIQQALGVEIIPTITY